ncbi:MAG: hypothetical protein IBX55_00325 [Methyloprofundus sp.]|nr:hypothetical protein [Methyloprofundus sp.]
MSEHSAINASFKFDNEASFDQGFSILKPWIDDSDEPLVFRGIGVIIIPLDSYRNLTRVLGQVCEIASEFSLMEYSTDGGIFVRCGNHFDIVNVDGDGVADLLFNEGKDLDAYCILQSGFDYFEQLVKDNIFDETSINIDDKTIEFLRSLDSERLEAVFGEQYADSVNDDMFEYKDEVLAELALSLVETPILTLEEAKELDMERERSEIDFYRSEVLSELEISNVIP